MIFLVGSRIVLIMLSGLNVEFIINKYFRFVLLFSCFGDSDNFILKVFILMFYCSFSVFLMGSLFKFRFLMVFFFVGMVVNIFLTLEIDLVR